MADTLGGIIDKLFTADMKMWHNQELLYSIRRMTFEQFEEEFIKNENGPKKLWECLKKVCDLNIQRNELIDEIDKKILMIIKDLGAGQDIDAKHLQLKHKTY
jgi:hypothetical protein